MSALLLVEGVAGVGKSTLIDGLVRRYVAERPVGKLRTLLHLSQAHTYGPLAEAEDDGTLTAEQNAAHLDSVVSMLEWQVGAVAGEAVRKLVAVVDTLHITHCRRPGIVGWRNVEAFDRRLAALGARLILLRATPETLWQRAIRDRQQTGFITSYAARRFGPSLESIHQCLVTEQAAMEEDVARSALEARVIAADAPLDTYLDPAYAFWLP